MLENSQMRIAVVGLGQAGSRFDEEPRPAVFSHVGACLALPGSYELVGGCDPLEENRRRFGVRCPGVPVFAAVSEMIAAARPDVVTVATPASVRRQVVEEIFAVHVPKLIILEKPLAASNDDRKAIVDLCSYHGVPSLVNYGRRYVAIYRELKLAMSSGKIGALRSVTIRYSNRVLTMGSHALDLLHFIAGEKPETFRQLEIPALREGEPAIDFICTFPSGAAGRILNHGFKKLYLFEVDVFGESGRLTVTDNGLRLDYSLFEPSDQYLGYVRQREPECLYRSVETESPFIELFRHAAAVLKGEVAPLCDAQVALTTEFLLDTLQAVERSGVGG